MLWPCALNAGLKYRAQLKQAEAGRPQQAIQDWMQAIGWQVRVAEAYFNRGVAYSRLLRREEAIAAFYQVLALSKDENLRRKAVAALRFFGAPLPTPTPTPAP